MSTNLYGAFGYMLLSHHYVSQSKSRLRSCLEVKELLAQNRRDIWSLCDINGIRTHNHLVRKQTLNHLAKLAKWLSCVVSTNLYSGFNCMLLCHVRVLEWIHFIVAWMSRNSLLKSLCDSNRIQIHNHLVQKQTLTQITWNDNIIQYAW